jgi:hypothetical protein
VDLLRVIIALAFVLPLLWAADRILQRMGFSGWWAILSLVVPLNIIGLVVLAVIEWPIDRRSRADS